MKRGRKKKPTKATGKFVQLVRAVTRLTEEDFAKEVGIPKATLKAISQGQRDVTDEHLELIEYAFGVRFSNDHPGNLESVFEDHEFTWNDFEKWKKVRKAASDSKEVTKWLASRMTRMVKASTANHKSLVVLFHLDHQINRISKNLGLPEMPGSKREEDALLKITNRIMENVDPSP